MTKPPRILRLSDPPDEELRAAFEQYGREKNGSGLSADEQLSRLNDQFPMLDIKYVSLDHLDPTHSVNLHQKAPVISHKKET